MKQTQKWPTCANVTSDHREKDLRSLEVAHAIEASTRMVSIRIDSRTIITTTPEKAERLRRRYSDLLSKQG